MTGQTVGLISALLYNSFLCLSRVPKYRENSPCHPALPIQGSHTKCCPQHFLVLLTQHVQELGVTVHCAIEL